MLNDEPLPLNPTEALNLAEAALRDPRVTVRICSELLLQTRETLGEQVYCRAHFLLGFAYRLLGSLDNAEGELLLARQLASSIDDMGFGAASELQLGLLYIDQLQHQRAIEHLKLAEEKYSVTGKPGDEARTSFALFNAYMQNGQEKEAVDHLEKALINFSDAGSDEGVTAVYCGLVLLDLRRGSYEEAIERADICLKVLSDKSLPKNRIFLNLARAEAYMMLKQTERALEIISPSLEAAVRDGYPLLEVRGLMLQHLALKDQQDDAEAELSMQKAEALAELHGFPETLEEIKKEYMIAV